MNLLVLRARYVLAPVLLSLLSAGASAEDSMRNDQFRSAVNTRLVDFASNNKAYVAGRLLSTAGLYVSGFVLGFGGPGVAVAGSINMNSMMGSGLSAAENALANPSAIIEAMVTGDAKCTK